MSASPSSTESPPPNDPLGFDDQRHIASYCNIVINGLGELRKIYSPHPESIKDHLLMTMMTFQFMVQAVISKCDPTLESIVEIISLCEKLKKVFKEIMKINEELIYCLYQFFGDKEHPSESTSSVDSENNDDGTFSALILKTQMLKHLQHLSQTFDLHMGRNGNQIIIISKNFKEFNSEPFEEFKQKILSETYVSKPTCTKLTVYEFASGAIDKKTTSNRQIKEMIFRLTAIQKLAIRFRDRFTNQNQGMNQSGLQVVDSCTKTEQ